jgi:hypothetical protein
MTFPLLLRTDDLPFEDLLDPENEHLNQTWLLEPRLSVTEERRLPVTNNDATSVPKSQGDATRLTTAFSICL